MPRAEQRLSVPPNTIYSGIITATWTGSAPTWIDMVCTQGGQVVISSRVAVEDGQAVFPVGPTAYYREGAGGADGTMTAKRWDVDRQRWIRMETATFHVSG